MNQPPPHSSDLAPGKMQVTTVFDPGRQVRTHQVTGVINLREFREILMEIYASKQFDPDMNALWDLRSADFSAITPEDVRTLMHVVVSNWGRSGTCRCAIVVASMLEFSIARIYESQFGRAAPCRIRVMMTMEQAWNWFTEAEVTPSLTRAGPGFSR